jgi:hypothetical protein
VLHRTDLVGPFLLDVSTSAASVSSGGSVLVSLDVATWLRTGSPRTPTCGVALPDSIALLQFTDPSFATACGSITDLAALSPLVAGVSLAGDFTLDGGELTEVLCGSEPPGIYTFYLVATRAGALADGSAGPGDVLFADTAPVVFTP